MIKFFAAIGVLTVYVLLVLLLGFVIGKLIDKEPPTNPKKRRKHNKFF